MCTAALASQWTAAPGWDPAGWGGAPVPAGAPGPSGPAPCWFTGVSALVRGLKDTGRERTGRAGRAGPLLRSPAVFSHVTAPGGSGPAAVALRLSVSIFLGWKSPSGKRCLERVRGLRAAGQTLIRAFERWGPQEQARPQPSATHLEPPREQAHAHLTLGLPPTSTQGPGTCLRLTHCPCSLTAWSPS